MPLRTLVVEDEMTIAMLIEDMLLELGHEVVDIATRLPVALELAKTIEIDLAILDVNLAGRPSYPVAELLDQRGIPLIFASGYGALDHAYRGRAIIPKPFKLNDLKLAISLALVAGGSAQ